MGAIFKLNKYNKLVSGFQFGKVTPTKQLRYKKFLRYIKNLGNFISSTIAQSCAS